MSSLGSFATAESTITTNFFCAFFLNFFNFHVFRVTMKKSISLRALRSFRLSMTHPMPFFPLLRILRHVRPYLWLQTLGPGRCLILFCQFSLQTTCIPLDGVAFKKVNWVKPVHGPDSSWSPSSFQRSLTCFSKLFFVAVVRRTKSTNFSETGNELFFFGTWSFTLLLKSSCACCCSA